MPEFLIIAGTSKAATTSLFNYLAMHREVCPSSEKETRYFLDAEYPLPSTYRYTRDGISKYLGYFDCASENEKRVEASPDYMYSSETAVRFMKDSLPDLKLVFVLREPVSRLLSWYRFGQSFNIIPKEMVFNEYFRIQESTPASDPQTRHPAFLALRHGRYSDYLKTFLEVFDRQNLHVCFYEDIQAQPALFMRHLCAFAGIDAGVYQDYEFKVVNKTMSVRSSSVHEKYITAKNRLKTSLNAWPSVRRRLRRVGRKVDDAYARLNYLGAKGSEIEAETMDQVRSYYVDEARRLEDLFGCQPPWEI